MGSSIDNYFSKILSMVVENLNFVDSRNYITISLKSIPKSFDLEWC